jgi:hypothetical protein
MTFSVRVVNDEGKKKKEERMRVAEREKNW